MLPKASWLLASAILPLFLFGLTLSAARAQPVPSQPAKPLVPVSVRFSWQIKGEFASLYVALDQGYFTQEGLNVTLGEGPSSQAALASVVQNQDQVAWMPGIYAVQAIAGGMPVKIVAVYNPVAPNYIISLPGKPIRTPQDLIGKTLGQSVGDTGMTYLGVLCTRSHIDCSKINRVTVAATARVPSLLAHKLDGVSVYKSNDMPILDAKFGDKAFVDLDLSKYGLRVLGASLIASNDYIAKNTDTLARLVRAINRGVRFCQSDPATAAKIMLKRWTTSLTPEIITEQINAFDDGVITYPGKPLGWVDATAISDTEAALKEANQMPKTPSQRAFFDNRIVTQTGAH